MSTKKYRMYLFMIAVLIIVAGIGLYFYSSGQEKSYKDGTLVYEEYVSEGEFA